jgi:hypothetical protein
MTVYRVNNSPKIANCQAKVQHCVKNVTFFDFIGGFQPRRSTSSPQGELEILTGWHVRVVL